jgi:hypothetical protein
MFFVAIFYLVRQCRTFNINGNTITMLVTNIVELSYSLMSHYACYVTNFIGSVFSYFLLFDINKDRVFIDR